MTNDEIPKPEGNPKSEIPKYRKSVFPLFWA
jgi:hypothetical protein